MRNIPFAFHAESEGARLAEDSRGQAAVTSDRQGNDVKRGTIFVTLHVIARMRRFARAAAAYLSILHRLIGKGIRHFGSPHSAHVMLSYYQIRCS